VFTLPVVAHAPTGAFCVHSSVTPSGALGCPPVIKDAEDVPAAAKPFLAVAILFCSDQAAPFHNSAFVVFAVPVYPPPIIAAVLLSPAP
jgi:hypothetical protein